VVNKTAISELFEELASTSASDAEKTEVCRLWGDLSLRCLCTRDDRCRELGIGLLEALSLAQPHLEPTLLAASAERTYSWLKQVFVCPYHRLHRRFLLLLHQICYLLETWICECVCVCVCVWEGVSVWERAGGWVDGSSRWVGTAISC
jgi:hypothetical protein